MGINLVRPKININTIYLIILKSLIRLLSIVETCIKIMWFMMTFLLFVVPFLLITVYACICDVIKEKGRPKSEKPEKIDTQLIEIVLKIFSRINGINFVINTQGNPPADT